VKQLQHEAYLGDVIGKRLMSSQKEHEIFMEGIRLTNQARLKIATADFDRLLNERQGGNEAKNTGEVVIFRKPKL
jgi:hypothetical protein